MSFAPAVATGSVTTVQLGGVRQTGTVSTGTTVNERQVVKFSGAKVV